MENKNENETKKIKKNVDAVCENEQKDGKKKNTHLFTKENAKEMQKKSSLKLRENREKDKLIDKKIDAKIKEIKKHKSYKEAFLFFLNEAIPDDNPVAGFLAKNKITAETFGEALAKKTVQNAIMSDDATDKKIAYDVITREWEKEEGTGGGASIIINNNFTDLSKTHEDGEDGEEEKE